MSVGIVVVSHSAALADAAIALAAQMVHGDAPRVVAAAGSGDDGSELGTDATRVAAAIVEAGADGDGVLVVVDLGSAVLSAELALELGDPDAVVRVSAGPFVEGLVAAVVTAAGGADLSRVAAEANAALDAKRAHVADDTDPAALADAPPAPTDPIAVAPDATGPDARGPAASGVEPDPVVLDVTLVNEVGLHARPASALVGMLRGFDADVRLENATTGRGPVPGASLMGVLALGVERGHVLRITATGAEAAAAAEAVRTAALAGFGEA